MSEKITLADLKEAARTGGSSALTSVTHLRPAAGEHALVSPAKYASGNNAVYVYEDRYLDGELVRTVLLDSRSSSANRLEEAIAQAVAEGHPVFARMPHIEVTYAWPDGRTETYADYELPHRAADGHVRVGSVDGQPVTANPVYRAARDSTPADAWNLLALSPVSVLFGLWDSTRKARQLRIPSAIVGEIIGVVGSAKETKRSGARVDPVGASVTLAPDAARAMAEAQSDDLNAKKLDGFRRAKGAVKGSEFVLGAIPPGTDAVDGIAATDIIRSHVLSFSTLRRLAFGKGVEGDIAIRALLAAMALSALARSDSELYLRANCHLVEKAPTAVTLDRRQGESTTFRALTVAEADSLLAEVYAFAHEVADVDWSGQVFDVVGNPAVVAGASDDESDGAA